MLEKRLSELNLSDISTSEMAKINGGTTPWGAIWFAASVLYSEIADAWEDGGKAIKEAYEAGKAAGYASLES